MRRLLSILLAIVLGLGPTLAALPASALGSSLAETLRAGFSGKPAESQLPACCRRNGKHHCALGMFSGQNEGRQTTIAANECCPCAPQALDSTAPSIAAILAVDAESPADLSEFRIIPTSRGAARLADRRSQPQRGPPATALL